MARKSSAGAARRGKTIKKRAEARMGSRYQLSAIGDQLSAISSDSHTGSAPPKWPNTHRVFRFTQAPLRFQFGMPRISCIPPVAHGVGLLAGAIGLVLWDVYRANALRIAEGASGPLILAAVRWRMALRCALVACLPLLLSASIAIVPSGMAGVLVSQISGVAPGTLYPGVHVVVPFVQGIALYDIRDQVFTTVASDDPKSNPKARAEVLKIQTKEGLPLGLAVSIRYRLDPKRLGKMRANTHQPVDQELVPAVVTSVFRQIVPGYLVRDVFAGMREEVRQRAAEASARKLDADGVLVKEIMLRDVQLPPEYAKGLESLLLKEQENDRLSVDLEIKQKQVHSAELEAEADKARRVTGAEAEAAVVVLQAKAQADAMQHTVPPT